MMIKAIKWRINLGLLLGTRGRDRPGALGLEIQTEEEEVSMLKIRLII